MKQDEKRDRYMREKLILSPWECAKRNKVLGGQGNGKRETGNGKEERRKEGNPATPRTRTVTPREAGATIHALQRIGWVTVSWVNAPHRTGEISLLVFSGRRLH